jgi:GH24 family phage-related lysozyme (muramidase)
MKMKTNEAGIALIKSFEGCKLTAYKPVKTEKYWTIGYGHYGADVKKGMKITQKQAEDFLRKDLEKFEKAVNALRTDFNENQFSALVSFAYNCGVGNLNKLCTGRTKPEIGSKMLLYDKAGGKSIAGLTRRRRAEYALYNTLPEQEPVEVYPFPKEVLKKGDTGNSVKWLQQSLNAKGYNLAVDGVFGDETEKIVKDFQVKSFVDGVVGELTLTKLVR